MINTGLEKLVDFDLIGIPSVSGRTDFERSENGRVLLEKLRFKVEYSENVFCRDRYFSGDDFSRTTSFNSFLDRTDVKGMVFARGGYGVLRILDKIDFKKIKNKFFMGYSDISILLNLIYEYSGVKTFHGPNLSEIYKVDLDILKLIFSGRIRKNLFTQFEFINPGKSRGVLKGGNLASLASLCGTKYFPCLEDSVLFIEDVNEPLYKLDRMLCQIKLAGKFEKLSGVIAGDFYNCGETEMIKQIILEYFHDVPVILTDEFGHGKINNPLMIGGVVVMDSNKNIAEYE